MISLWFIIFPRNSYVTVEAGKDLGEIQRIKIGHDNAGISPGWFLKKVENISWNLQHRLIDIQTSISL